MGMYTGLRAKLVIKSEFRPVIQSLVNLADITEDPWQARESSWMTVANLYPQYPFLKEWASWWRSDFIPFGALCYMPWDEADPVWQHTFEDGVWTFQCSLKNYTGEIDAFTDGVLSHIVESVITLHSLYEEDEEVEDLMLKNQPLSLI